MLEHLTGMSRGKKRSVLLAVDLFASQASLAAVVAALHPPAGKLLLQAGVLAIVVPVVAVLLGLQEVKLTAYDQDGLPRSAALAMAACGPLWIAGLREHDALLAFLMCFLLIAVALRLIMLRLLLALLRKGQPRCPVIVYGAGQTGVQLALALKRDRLIQPVALVDEQADRLGQRLAGLRVHAPTDLPWLRQHWDARHIILAMPSESPVRLRVLTRRLQESGFVVRVVPSFAQLAGAGDPGLPLSAVPAELYLPRAAIHPDLAEVALLIAGKSVLVTGAGGSIGSELCRHLIACAPATLVLLDHSEAALYTIDAELNEIRRECRLVSALGSITDAQLLRDLLARHSIDTVIHSAAYKHVPMAEKNPVVAAVNNVIGTRTLADCSARAGVRRFVQISTDKAVRPVGVMGATKRLAEIVVQDLARRHPATNFSIVRFGNVLGSSGSVVPLFRQQIERGGPVTVTHPDVTRFFMTPGEAARLVLAVLGFPPLGRAGVFLLDMGAPLRILDLAHRMIGEAGLAIRDAACPQGDIEVRLTGLRAGEKLHEEVLIDTETQPTPHPRILRANEAGLSAADTARALKDLTLAIAGNDPSALRRTLFNWVEAGPDACTPSIRKGETATGFVNSTVVLPAAVAKSRPAIDAAMQHRIY